MRRVVELIKEVVNREPDPVAARARPRPIDRAWKKAKKLLQTTLVKSLGFILHSTLNLRPPRTWFCREQAPRRRILLKLRNG
jgi:hypothetical protein